MTYPTLHDSYEENPFVPRSPQLQKVEADLGPERVPEPDPPRRLADPGRRRPRGGIRYPRIDPGSAAVVRELSRRDPTLASFDLSEYQASSESESDEEMTEFAHPEEAGVGDFPTSAKDAATSTKSEPAERPSAKTFDASKIANAALQHQARTESDESASDSPSVQRHDSGHAETFPQKNEKSAHAGRTPDLTVVTQHADNSSKQSDDSMAASPTLRKHMAEGAAGTLPAIDGQVTSPHLEKLPPIRQITMGGDSLNDLAEVATQQDPRSQPLGHQHSQSFGSAASPPALPYHPHTAAQQASPGSHFAMSARSPASAMSDPYYGSPPHSSTSAYYVNRRPSAAANAPNFISLPSAASSNESQGPGTSSADGYTPSTAHTTPNDQGTAPDATPGHNMAPTQSPQVTHGYRCDHEGCTAAPFQTQYLLSSHRNVHSSTRNHFCPVVGCARADGGKGFKRKNEMKRHALVHQSPGYTCPFCPDKEHKYPRPDNLQRHVRVHHVDKSKDDALLRDVLAARPDGSGKIARRRRNTAS